MTASTGSFESGAASATFLHEADADLADLAGQRVAVLGYGNLGRSMALNLRDSGLDVVVGNIDDEYRVTAAGDGFQVADLGDAATGADVVYVLLPDEVIPGCFAEQIGTRLKAGAAVCFASGYALAFHLAKPPAESDVLLLAPRMAGEQVRVTYLDGSGFVAFVSVEQDATGTASRRLNALALAAGALKRGCMVLPAQQEALLDLFVEQSVGPYLGLAFQLAFWIGTENGLPPEALVLELYMSGEMSRVVQAFADQGFYQAVGGHGLAAAYGGFLGTMAIDGEAMAQRFRQALEEVRDGTFARKFQEEQAAGYPTLGAIQKATSLDTPLSAAEERVRAELFFRDAGDAGDSGQRP